MNYKQQAEYIREERDAALICHLVDIRKYVEKIPKEKIEKIIDSTATELAQMLNKGDTTSVELVNIFAYRAGTVGHQLTAITEDNFVQALKMAKQCDQKRKANGGKNLFLLRQELQTPNKDHLPPFFGVPISIKDTVDMKGFASTIGCVERYYVTQPKDGEIISVLKTSGMIPFVRTNVPQLCMSYECNNNLWGNTQNPWNRLRTPGGSSGGEASLVASRSSPIGLGGDIGGSLRIPAEFCGLCTLKSTSQRITSGGHTSFSPSIDGQINIRATMGPLAKSVQDLSSFLSILMSQNYYNDNTIDAYRKLQPFDTKMFKSVSDKNSNLKIGYYDSFDFFPSSFASRRAVHEVISILKNKGHTIIPIKIPRIDQLSKILVSTTVAEGGLQGYEEILDGEPIAKEYHEVKRALQLPRFVHWALIKILEKISPRMAFALGEVKKLSTHQYLCLTSLQKQLKQQFLKMWKEQNLDFIIAPGFGTQAPLVGLSCKMSILPSMYSNIWNVLDMTVGSLPVTKVRLEQQKYPNEYKDCYERANQQNLKGTEGLPVGIQVISLPYRDEQVLGMMKIIEQEVKFREKYSYPI